MLHLAFLLLMFTSSFVVAAAEFYRAEVPATDGEAGRERALAAALQVVVRQVTGDPEVAASPQLAPEYDAAARYARTWRVIDSPHGSRLEVAFDQAAVDAMLAGHGLAPRTGRPSVLVCHGVTSRMLRTQVLGWGIGRLGDLPGGQGVIYRLAEGRHEALQT